MSEDWIEIIGDYKTIVANTTKALLGRAFYLTILKHKDTLLDNSNIDQSSQETNPYHMYETLVMALATRKKDDPKPTYIGTKKTSIKGTKEKKIEKDVKLPMKKFANITGEVKNCIVFLLSKFINECEMFYRANKNSFPTLDKLLTQLCQYSSLNASKPIASSIIRSSDVIDIENVVPGYYAQSSKLLAEKIRVIFKDAEDKAPDKHLDLIAESFLKFMKIIAVYMADLLYEKRQAVNGVLFYGVIRQLNSQLKQHNCKIDDGLIDDMKEYVEISKPKKESNGKGKGKKKKSDEDQDEDQDDEDQDDEDQDEDQDDEEQENKKKKKKSKESKETKEVKKTRGRPRTNKKNSPSKKDQSDNEAPDIDDEMDKMGDGDWTDEAEYAYE